jgi:hypothetical protein
MRRRTQTLLMIVSALCALLFALSLLLWIRSYWVSDSLHVVYRTGPYGLTMPLLQLAASRGGLFLLDLRGLDGDIAYDSVEYASRPASAGSESFLLRFDWGNACINPASGPFFHASAPLWSFALVFMIVGGIGPLVVYRQRRRRRTGLCPQCGYDLTGNVSGRCPECGAPAPTQSAQSV